MCQKDWAAHIRLLSSKALLREWALSHLQAVSQAGQGRPPVFLAQLFHYGKNNSGFIGLDCAPRPLPMCFFNGILISNKKSIDRNNAEYKSQLQTALNFGYIRDRSWVVWPEPMMYLLTKSEKIHPTSKNWSELWVAHKSDVTLPFGKLISP